MIDTFIFKASDLDKSSDTTIELWFPYIFIKSEPSTEYKFNFREEDISQHASRNVGAFIISPPNKSKETVAPGGIDKYLDIPA